MLRCTSKSLRHWGGVRVIIFNSGYDWPLIEAACARHGLAVPAPSIVECAMMQYSTWVGDWNDYRGNYRWQKLPSGDHSALGDARATLKVLRTMAGLEF